MTLFAAIDQRVLTALVVAGALAVFGVLLVATAAGELRGRRKAKVPSAFRPAPSDEELERRVLERYLAWGALTTLFMALWLPAYWLYEPTRMDKKAQAFKHLSVEGRDHGEDRSGGAQLYHDFCRSCHGDNAEGEFRAYVIDGKNVTYAEPPLRLIYARYKAAGRSQDEIKQIVYDAINRGRPNTPMPTWGFQFGGPLNSYQVDNLVSWIESIQIDAPAPASADGAALFAANCAVCHGDDGEGGVGPNLQVAFERLSRRQIFDTIMEGRLNMNRPSMPAWAFLGEDAVRALVEHVESLQRSSR